MLRSLHQSSSLCCCTSPATSFFSPPSPPPRLPIVVWLTVEQRLGEATEHGLITNQEVPEWLMCLQLLHSLSLYFPASAALQQSLQWIFPCCCHGAGRATTSYLQQLRVHFICWCDLWIRAAQTAAAPVERRGFQTCFWSQGLRKSRRRVRIYLFQCHKKKTPPKKHLILILIISSTINKNPWTWFNLC